MYNRIVSFLEKCNIISNSQHGFVKARSTCTAIFDFLMYTLKNFETREISIGIFLDLSKAFDCVDHNILIDKLSRYGIRGRVLEWIRSYLTNRQQYVRLVSDDGGCNSDLKTISTGVPQGSVLGPLLFILYINDLPSHVVDARTICYADDTNLLVTGKDLNELSQTASNVLAQATTWFQNNKLSLNKNKTTIILFQTSQGTTQTPKNITLDTYNFELSTDTKFLGLTINQHIKWSSHLNDLARQLSKICYSMRHMSRSVGTNTLRTMYFGSFLARLRYGIIFWGATNTNAIFKFQKYAVRILAGMRARDSCRGVFKSHGLMTLPCVYFHECVMFVRKNPSVFNSYKLNHNLNTRGANDFRLPAHSLTSFEEGALYNCLKLYNHLPEKIKNIESLPRFKEVLRNELVNKEFYHVNEFIL